MWSCRAGVVGLGLLIPALVVASGVFEREANGQDATTSPDKDNAAKRAERLEEMDRVAGTIEISSVDNQGKETPAVMSEKPLLRWTDPTREFSDGGLWVWRVSGRPVAAVGIELYAWWSLEFASLSPGVVRGKASEVRWTPQKGVAFKDVPGAPVPAADEAGRLRQMRELATRFVAREYWVGGNGQHYALRLLTRPLDRYADPANGVVDGSLFAFAHGTNPEILLIVEAHRNGDKPPKWSFAAAPLSHAEVALRIGTQDVWTSPSKDAPNNPRPEDPYFDRLTPRLPAGRSRPHQSSLRLDSLRNPGKSE